MTLFSEKRWFSLSYFVLLGIILIPLFLVGIMAGLACGSFPYTMLPAVVILILVFPLRMCIKVSDTHLVVKAGLCFGKRIKIQDIDSHRVVQCEPWTYGKWGNRASFEGKPCRFYNTDYEKRGVLVETSKDRLIILSDKPEALNDAIDKAINGSNQA